MAVLNSLGWFVALGKCARKFLGDRIRVESPVLSDFWFSEFYSCKKWNISVRAPNWATILQTILLFFLVFFFHSQVKSKEWCIGGLEFKPRISLSSMFLNIIYIHFTLKENWRVGEMDKREVSPIRAGKRSDMTLNPSYKDDDFASLAAHVNDKFYHFFFNYFRNKKK